MMAIIESDLNDSPIVARVERRAVRTCGHPQERRR